MGSHDVAQLLATLGVTKSHSRPHVSNDNPFSESQFKTLKYRPEFPKRFEGYEHALGFCRKFFAWYNDEHLHSAVGENLLREAHRLAAPGRREHERPARALAVLSPDDEAPERAQVLLEALLEQA